jgi:hypothetical protein
VPALVPSVFQSAFRCTPSPPAATKKSMPFTTVSESGREPAVPGRRSTTCVVPPTLPSLFHSSTSLFDGPLAEKKAIPPNSVRLTRLFAPICLSMTVPALVPSLVQIAAGFVGGALAKKSFPPALVRSKRVELSEPAARFATRAVPAAVPLLFQSSLPFTKSLAT